MASSFFPGTLGSQKISAFPRTILPSPAFGERSVARESSTRAPGMRCARSITCMPQWCHARRPALVTTCATDVLRSWAPRLSRAATRHLPVVGFHELPEPRVRHVPVAASRIPVPPLDHHRVRDRAERARRGERHRSARRCARTPRGYRRARWWRAGPALEPQSPVLTDERFSEGAVALALHQLETCTFVDATGCDQDVEGLVPAVLVPVKRAVTLDDPPHVAGPMHAQRDFGGTGIASECLLDRAHRRDQALLIAQWEVVEQCADLVASPGFEWRHL